MGRKLIDSITIRQIIALGLVVRLLAVIFSPGYAFHDDHFEMAELVFKWRDGISFLWAPGNVHVFSLVYPGMLYLLFEGCSMLGIRRPEDVMLVVRLVHALVSLLTIYYGYLLTLRLTKGEKNTAKLVVLAMALFWIFPFMSVRTLREFFCIPFLMIGSYFIADPKLSYRSIAVAAFFFAISFCIRFQIIFFPVGVGLSLLFKKRYVVKAFAFGLAFLVGCLITQGLFDLLRYHDPLASVLEYIRFNTNQANIGQQPQGPWHRYIGTIAGIALGFPFLLFAWGYVYSARISFQTRMFFVASILFFAFHSYYSNKQERFILPFVPYFLLLGIIGFSEYRNRQVEKTWLKKATRLIIAWLLVLNTAGLIILCFTYSKRSRVESMIYLRKRGDVDNIIMEGDISLQRPPLFYLDRHLDYYTLSPSKSIDVLRSEIDHSGKPVPNYVIMAGNADIDHRLDRLRILFPGMKFLKMIHAGWIDRLVYWLNPKNNQNEDWYIYRTN